MLDPVTDAQTTLAERLFHDLTQMILDGTLAPGAKISEPQLAQRYGVSRGPVREALHRLQERRLITRSANQGPRVVSLTREGLMELFLIREALEGVAAREASRLATPADISALEENLERHGADIATAGRTGRPVNGTAAQDFHYMLAQITKNQALIQLLCTELYPLLRLYRGQGGEVIEKSERALLEHRRILDAIIDRDDELAEIQMRRHVAAAKTRRSEALAANGAEAFRAPVKTRTLKTRSV